jgi:hypothetical protein
MTTATKNTCKLSGRSLNNGLSIWGVATVAAMFLGQAATAAPIALYDSITGNTASAADTADSTQYVADKFLTDAFAYDLNSVVLDLVNSPAGVAVELYSDNSGVPGSSLGSFTTPGSLADGPNTFTASGLPTLTSNSAYWIVLRGIGSGSADWQFTDGSGTVSPNWQTLSSAFRTSLGGAWNVSSTQPYMMTINATAASAVPEIDPASFGSALSLVLGSLTLLERRRRQG